MNFSNDYLAELETPTRIFRTNIEKCVSPTKPRSKDLFLNDLFLAKREILELDDYPNIPFSIKNEFFSEEIVQPEAKVTKIVEAETREVSQQVDGPSPLTVKGNPTPLPDKFKSEELLTETVKQPDIKKSPKILNKDFLSDDEQLKKEIKAIASPKLQPHITSTKNIDLPDIDNINNKYQTYVQQRKSTGIIDKGIKRKKTSMCNTERNQIKTRALRVSTFWKGENSFIPSVFKVIKLENDSQKVLIEFQDFSLKGLCHMEDNYNDAGNESKLSSQLDRLGDKNLYDVYEMMGGRPAL